MRSVLFRTLAEVIERELEEAVLAVVGLRRAARIVQTGRVRAAQRHIHRLRHGRVDRNWRSHIVSNHLFLINFEKFENSKENYYFKQNWGYCIRQDGSGRESLNWKEKKEFRKLERVIEIEIEREESAWKSKLR